MAYQNAQAFISLALPQSLMVTSCKVKSLAVKEAHSSTSFAGLNFIEFNDIAQN
jgi:hypothetical protein